MTRSSVDVERIVDCPFSFALEEADAVFDTLERSGAALPLRAFGVSIPGTLAQRVKTKFTRRRDSLEPGRSHDEIAFAWEAQRFWLPDLSGVLRFRIEALRTRVILHGEYRPPLGTLGRAFDRFIGKRLAAATLTEVVERLQLMLEGRYRTFEAAYE